MMLSYRSTLLNCAGWVASLFFSAGVTAQSSDVPALLQEVDAYTHTQQVEFSEREVIDYEVGLGAIQKIRGEWHFKDSDSRVQCSVTPG